MALRTWWCNWSTRWLIWVLPGTYSSCEIEICNVLRDFSVHGYHDYMTAWGINCLSMNLDPATEACYTPIGLAVFMVKVKGQLINKKKITPDFYKTWKTCMIDCAQLSLVKCGINQSSNGSGSHLFISLLLCQFVTLLLQLQNGERRIIHPYSVLCTE